MLREKIVPAAAGYEVVPVNGEKMPVLAWLIRGHVPRPVTPMGVCFEYEALICPDGATVGYVDGELKHFAYEDHWRDAVKGAAPSKTLRRVRNVLTRDAAYAPPSMWNRFASRLRK